MVMAFSTSSWERRSGGFRSLLCKLSESLTESDVSQIEYIRSVPARRAGDRLGVLTALEKKGEFSPNHTEPLVRLLQEIHRHDLAQQVSNTYQALYPDVGEASGGYAADPALDESLHHELVVGSAPEDDDQFGVDEFDRRNVANRSFPLTKISRNTPRRPSDSTMVISVQLPLSPSHSLNQRTLSIHSQVSDSSNKVASTTSLKLKSETFSSSNERQAVGECGMSVTAQTSRSSTAEEFAPLHSPIEVCPPKKQGLSGWKYKIGWRARKDGEKELMCQRRISKYAWNIKSEGVLPLVRRGGHLQCIYCPEHIHIDIECRNANPHLSLSLYPYGLFEDVEKSMTLQFKVVIPDSCPPIPTKATFDLSWEIFVKGAADSFRKIETHKQSLQVKFKIGMGYIHKFLPHSQLPNHDFKSLEIEIRVSTAYSIRDT